MARNLLHKEKLEDFKYWLDKNSVLYRPGKGDYQILQVRFNGHWLGVYERHDMKEHLSTDTRLDPLVFEYCRARKPVIPKEKVKTAVTVSKKQTRLVSFIEACMNTFIGFWVSFIIFPFAGWLSNMDYAVSSHFIFVSVFTVASVLRGYGIRRFFENGLHLIAVKLAKRFMKR